MKNIVGKILKELLDKEGAPTKEDFSQMLGISYKTLYNVTKGTSNLTFDQVVRASDILKYDIGEEYYKRMGKEKGNEFAESANSYMPLKNLISVTLTISGALSTFASFPQLLAKVRDDAREFGFEIG